mmetsp:Transcript_9934/g.32412  ORF Transcript_9934/g.32412 Transcript_9934/m.32412 type:complete len:223 (-) Transcript_9934:329-997(-)
MDLRGAGGEDGSDESSVRRGAEGADPAEGRPRRPAVLAGHAERRQGDDFTGGAERVEGSRVRRVEGQHLRPGPVRLGLRPGEPELEDPLHARLRRRRRASARLRVRGHAQVLGREVRRRLRPEGLEGKDRDLQLALLADGHGALRGWRLRPLLLLRPRENPVRHRPLHHGSQTGIRRPRQGTRHQNVHRRRRIHHRRHGHLALGHVLHQVLQGRHLPRPEGL